LEHRLQPVSRAEIHRLKPVLHSERADLHRTGRPHDRAMTFFLENLGRFERGEALENVVDKNEQY
jgi:hypothetical protein